MTQGHDYSAWASGFAGEDKRLSGMLCVTPRALLFSGGERTLEIPLAGLRVTRGGAGNRYIFFSHRQTAPLQFYTSDTAILADPALTCIPELVKEISRVRTGFRLARVLLVAAVLLVVLGLLCLKPAGDFLIQRSVVLVPRSWEQTLGESAIKPLLLHKKKLETPEIQAGVKALVTPLLKVWPDLEFTPTFYVVADSEVNAFALPGGVIVLNSGLLLRAETSEEVIGILGHELAHAALRHHLRHVVKAQWFYFLCGNLLGDLTPTLNRLAANTSQFLSLQFSRDFEREADCKAFDVMVKAELDPAGLVSLFDKLSQEEVKLGILSRGLTLLSTHPAPEARSRSIGEKRDQLGKRTWKKSEVDFKVFQEEVRKAEACVLPKVSSKHRKQEVSRDASNS